MFMYMYMYYVHVGVCAQVKVFVNPIPISSPYTTPLSLYSVKVHSCSVDPPEVA